MSLPLMVERFREKLTTEQLSHAPGPHHPRHGEGREERGPLRRVRPTAPTGGCALRRRGIAPALPTVQLLRGSSPASS